MSTLGWAKAWLHEASGDRRGTSIVFWLAETVVLAYVIDRMLSIAPVLAIALASMNVWRVLRVRALPLSAGIFHPVSRLTRVTVAFWSRAAAIWIRGGVLVGFIAAFDAILNRMIGPPSHITGVPLGTGMVPAANGTPALLALTLSVFVVIGLITQTVPGTMVIALGGTWPRHAGGLYASYLTGFLLPMTGAIAFAHWANTEHIASEAAAVAVVMIGTFVFYWLALRRSSVTTDLV